MRQPYLISRFCGQLKEMSKAMLSTSTPISSDHLSSTQSSSRKEVISPATVLEIKDESKTVKVLTLQVSDKDLSFKAGQWVDTFIPGVETVGGFSMCSSPSFLKEKSLLVLAIKFSEHPPALWIHTKCKPGDVVQLRVGGDFFFDPQPGEKNDSDILLVAGGVGINPLYSMMNHVAHLNISPDGPHKGNVLLLYSARTTSELIFKDQLLNLDATHSNITAHFFASGESSAPSPVQCGRITLADIKTAVQDLKADNLKVYMCGPSPMVQDMEQYCITCGVAKQQIFYERWW